MKVTIDTDTYIGLLENAIDDLKDGKNISRTREILEPPWLEQSIDKLITDEVEGGECDKDAFHKSVREQLEQYSKEMGGAIPDSTGSDETVLKKRIIHLKALNASRRK